MNNIDIRNLSLGDILYFCKMAEYHSVTKTAEHFHLTQSAVSKKINALEGQLGLQLFIREKKQFKLTPAGKYIYQQWKHLPDKIGNDIQTGHILQQGYEMSLTIAVLDSFCPESFFLPAIRSFVRTHPDIPVTIESGAAQDIREMLISGQADIIFSVLYDFENKVFEDVEWQLLGTSPHYVCMLPDNPLASQSSLRMGDLKQFQFFCISPHVLPEYSHMLQELGRQAGFLPDIKKYVTSPASLTLNMIGTREVYICDKYFRDFNDKSFCFIPLENTKSGYVMAWRKNENKAILKEFLRELTP